MKPIIDGKYTGIVSAALLALFLGISAWTVPAEAAAPRKTINFDHTKTGFPLSGQHAQVKCESCHIRGVFKGTPNQCATCHVPGSRTASTAKSANHIPTNAACDQCHASTVSWGGARFKHIGIDPGSCAQCHNSRLAAGKPGNHPTTTESCDTCHRTTTWTAPRFNHVNVRAGTCAQCHDGTKARGKPNTPVHQTTSSCDTCHKNFISFAGATVDHSGVIPGQCASCHNGSTATGTNNATRHIPTGGRSCDSCHRISPNKFAPSTFAHSAAQGVTPGQCATCHSGSYTNNGKVMGKPNTPVHQTNTACDSCHKNFSSFAGATVDHSTVVPGQCGSCHNGANATGKGNRHIPTGLSCDSCHRTAPNKFAPATFTHSAVQGVIPGQCATCHSGGYTNNGKVLGKPGTPVHQTSASCDSCHKNYISFAGASVDHSGVIPGQCGTCHNGSTATGKGNRHIPTGLSCDSCHRSAPNKFVPATFTHSAVQGVTPGQCATCHSGGYTNNGKVLGKPGTPVHQTSASCDSCHKNYISFAGASVDHSGVIPGQCGTCHNGSTATGKGNRHIPTGLSCDSCHRTAPNKFVPATFTHSVAQGVLPGQCGTSCHTGAYVNNGKVLGKPAGHYTPACDNCHKNYTTWKPMTTYSHVSPNFRPHNANATCVKCHLTNGDTPKWGAYKPDCASCHSGNFKADSHKKVDSPKVVYTVAELKDCTGSCHRYTDNTFTTIAQSRTSKHRSTDGGF
jgi:hypothetical protein